MRLRVREWAARINGPVGFTSLPVGTEIRDLRQYRGYATFRAQGGHGWELWSVLGRVRVR